MLYQNVVKRGDDTHAFCESRPSHEFSVSATLTSQTGRQLVYGQQTPLT